MSLESQIALSTRDGSLRQAEFIFEPYVRVELGRGMEFTALGRLLFDAVDELKPGDPPRRNYSGISRPLGIGTRVELELRELFLDADIGPGHLRIGKQQIVWGESDGLKVLDVVNPQDFREFILDDFEDSRIPLWAFNLEWPVGPFEIQAIWLTDPTFHALPEPGAEFAFTTPLVVPRVPVGVDVEMRGLRRPTNLVTDSDSGLRISTSLGGWDLALSYLYFYEDEPVLERELRLGPEGPLAVITPGYRRDHLFGATTTSAVGDFTVRGELAFRLDRQVSTNSPLDRDGLIGSRELAYVVGLDWYGLSDSLVSFQFFQRWLPDRDSGAIRPELRTSFTLFLQRRFANDRGSVEMMWIHNLNDHDGVVRPKVSYELNDQTSVWTGFDLFYGTRDGLFGEFRDRNRFVLGIQRFF